MSNVANETMNDAFQYDLDTAGCSFTEPTEASSLKQATSTNLPIDIDGDDDEFDGGSFGGK